ncbi:HAMP domain-containing sensor histidine kinase [Alicyclobacillus acidiphilus]|uniref:HAMP domain-containing sensor histidine kinase n=1 Tax=Alicyclobacillus acidiphilus TaxID=182455 RepID=UPI0008307396|nr:sensor histidine kinase [Alicyclobacillus acidiphilus]
MTVKNGTIRTRFATYCGLLGAAAFAGGAVCDRLAGYGQAEVRGHIGTWACFGVGALVVGALVGYWLAQGIRRRIYDIEEAAVLIAGGRLHHRITETEGRDEINEVVQAFNAMGERIESQVAALQKLAQENFDLAQTAERAAQMEERQRLSRELHDSVSQQLFSLTLLSAALRDRCPAEDTGLAALAAQMEVLASQAQREMRALLLHMRPIDLDGRGLREAIEAFLQAVGDRHGLACVFRDDTATVRGSVIDEQLFRITQEAVTNVLKHANASTVTVTLSESSAYVELTVSDDGRGMPIQQRGEALGTGGDTIGLSAMRERAERLGGQLSILHRDQGTTVRAVIPLMSSGGSEESP